VGAWIRFTSFANFLYYQKNKLEFLNTNVEIARSLLYLYNIKFPKKKTSSILQDQVNFTQGKRENKQNGSRASKNNLQIIA
jgi:hypothetical protein